VIKYSCVSTIYFPDYITDHEEAKVVELAHGAAQWPVFVSSVVKPRVTHGKNTLTVIFAVDSLFQSFNDYQQL
jgi:hypothetical protein